MSDRVWLLYENNDRPPTLRGVFVTLQGARDAVGYPRDDQWHPPDMIGRICSIAYRDDGESSWSIAEYKVQGTGGKRG